MNLKRFLFPKYRKFEGLIQRYAVYSPDMSLIRMAPTARIFDAAKLEKLSSGTMARVFKFKKMDWVVKEGRWDLDLDLFGGAKMPLPAELTEKVLDLFSFTFLPSLKEISRQNKMYLQFVEYFGFFKSSQDYYHPNLDLIQNGQKNIRESLTYYKAELEKFYKMKINDKILAILNSDVRYHNFLPKEYLLVGPSISPVNKGKSTYFIVQEFIKGKHLHDISAKSQPSPINQQLILMSYLILLMNMQIHLVPDTRPRYPILQMDQWLTKTDNIIVSHNAVKFIDTRWCWDSKSNFIKRGLIIPNMIINLTKNYLNSLLANI